MTDHRRRIFKLWERRDDPSVAIELLAIERDYVAAGDPLPPLLARWRVQANDAAVSAPNRDDGKRIEDVRATAHLRALGLAHSDNRPTKFVSKFVISMAIFRAGDAYCEAKVRRIVQADFGVTANTARDRIRYVKEQMDEGGSPIGGLRRPLNALRNRTG